MKELDITQLKDMLLYVAELMAGSKNYLCEIDGRIGDGDHGIGIERGFIAVKEVLLAKSFNSINEIFRETGMAMLNSMGGASGVIFSAVFLGITKEPATTNLTIETFIKMCREGLSKIKKQGKAQKGDKTMVDALEPAVEAMESALPLENFLTLLDLATNAAQEGMEATKTYPARFGRAKFLKERSIGCQDAGATSVFLIFRFMKQWLENQKS